MECYEVESTPFYTSPDSLILLFRGVSVKRQRLPIVVRRHLFDLLQDSTHLGIYQSLNTALSQAKTQHPFYRDALDVFFDLSDSQCIISFVLEARDLDPNHGDTYTEMELQAFLQPSYDRTQLANIGDIKRDYNLEEPKNKSGTLFYRGRDSNRGGLEAIVKHHTFSALDTEDTQDSIAQTLSTALAQARVHHPNSCNIYEVRLQFCKKQCFVYHVLEALNSDVWKDIQERKKFNRPYTEEELRDFLLQTSGALAYAHSKGVAHRDLAPDNIFKSGRIYKIGDYGCFFIKKDGSYTVSCAGHLDYMSPQLRKAHMWRNQPYNAFKADVFALGATLYAMITLNSPSDLIIPEGLDNLVGESVARLPCSQLLRDYIQAMMRESEETRPRMQKIFRSISQQILSLDLALPSTALLFCTFTREGYIDADHFHEVMKILASNFGPNNVICPLLILGSQGHVLMENLIRQSGASREGDVLLQMQQGGVYVWPRPIVFGSVVTMLLFLSSPEGVVSEEAKRKARAGLMALSSMCCLCETNEEMASETDIILQDYASIRKVLHVEISKLFLLPQDSNTTAIKELERSHAGLVEVISANGGLDILARSVSNGKFHAKYINSHINLFVSNPISGYLSFLQDYMRTDCSPLSSPTAYKNLKALRQRYISTEEEGSALPFIVISREEQDFILELIEETSRILIENFSHLHAFLPMLVFGSYGENAWLRSLIAKAGNWVDEDSFECDKDAPHGAYVWSQPVYLHGTPLMLIIMKTDPVENEEYRLITRKLRLVLTAFSSVCCMLKAKHTIVDTTKEFILDYDKLRSIVGLEISKLLVFVEKNSLVGKFGKELDIVKKEHKALLHCIYYDNIEVDIEPVITLLAKEGFHLPYLRSREGLFGPQCIGRFLSQLNTYIRLACFPLMFDAFLSKLSPLFDTNTESKLFAIKHSHLMLCDSRPLEFFDRYAFSGNQYSANIQTLETIKMNYCLTKPTVIFTILGFVGVGKTTLLNEIIRYCTGTSLSANWFRVGICSWRTRKWCQVLSHPLSYEGKQIMLMDVEGLEDTETIDIDNYCMQESLLSAVLTIASVPCIIVSNNLNSMKLVEKIVAKIAAIQQNLGFLTERICLLFWDRNEYLEINQELFSLVNNLNWLYFSSRNVVVILNKPNFEYHGNAKDINSLLSRLLSQCLYCKRTANGRPILLNHICDMISIISSFQNLGKSDLVKGKVNIQFIDSKKKQLAQIAESVKSSCTRDYLLSFNEEVALHFIIETNAEIAGMRDEKDSDNSGKIDLAINLHRAQMMKRDTMVLWSSVPRATIRIKVNKALELVSVNSLWGNGQITTEVVRYLEEMDPSMFLVLLIGTKSSRVSKFADYFVHQIVPLETSSFFTSKTYTQILPIPHIHPLIEGGVGRAVLICLRMDSNKDKISRAMVAIAQVLLPAASFACFLEDGFGLHTYDVLNSIPIPSICTDESSLPNTKVIIIHSRECEVGGWRSKLHRCNINYELKEVLGFKGENIKAAVGEIKGELKRWEITRFTWENQGRRRTLHSLKVNILTLPAILSEFHL